MPMMPFTGVRISWLITARNVRFAAFALPACSANSRTRSFAASSSMFAQARLSFASTRAMLLSMSVCRSSNPAEIIR